MRQFAAALLFCELFMSAGCEKKSCRPGEQIGCDCPGGGPRGVQVCSRDGRRFSSCDCPSPPPKSSHGTTDPTAWAPSAEEREAMEVERRKEELKRQLREAQEQASSRAPAPPSSGKCGCAKTDPLCDCL